jgi:hypothetical protein
MTEEARDLVKRLADEHWELIAEEQSGLVINYLAVLPRVLLLVEKANATPGDWDELIGKAKNGLGDADADSALCYQALCLIDQGLPLPDPIRGYAMGVMLRAATARNRRKGTDPYKFVARDIFILNALKRLQDELQISPTRSQASDHECGCSIVARELNSRGIDIQERGVEEVYGKRREKWGIA